MKFVHLELVVVADVVNIPPFFGVLILHSFLVIEYLAPTNVEYTFHENHFHFYSRLMQLESNNEIFFDSIHGIHPILLDSSVYQMLQ